MSHVVYDPMCEPHSIAQNHSDPINPPRKVSGPTFDRAAYRRELVARLAAAAFGAVYAGGHSDHCRSDIVSESFLFADAIIAELDKKEDAK